jgi:hypothetical protein
LKTCSRLPVVAAHPATARDKRHEREVRDF